MFVYGSIKKMDPAESILSTLDCTFDSLMATQDESNFGSMIHDDMNVGGVFDDFLTNDFDNDFLMNSDDWLSTFINDHHFPNSFDLDDESNFTSSLFSSNTKRSKSPKASNNLTINNIKNTNPIPTVSILKNPTEKSSVVCRPKISITAPKVYFSQKSKKGEKGTSILVKQKKFNKRSALLSNTIVTQQQRQQMESNKHIRILSDDVYWVNNSLRDHDYCSINFFSGIDENFHTTNDAQVMNKNEIEDILGGYCTDDVVLNELPECLSNLIGFGDDLINSEDLLNGLNDVCNFMTDQYIEENLLNKDDLNLPDLNLTEEDLNQVTQIDNVPKEVEEDSVLTKDVEMNAIYSPCTNESSNVDNYDSASVTTGCTEESFLDEKQCLRLKDQIKSKRNRSLSSSSTILSKRKRRFSTRSSINSSDAMSSDSSSLESSSSRNSSPERAFNFASNFASNDYHAKNFDSFNNKFHLNKKKNRLEIEKAWNRAYSKKNISKKVGKCQVIDMVSKQKYTLDSRLEANGSSQSEVTISSSNGGHLNENVLYIGNIPDGIKKNDIKAWFDKFGTIEDIQIFTKNAKCFAFVTYENVYETNEAIKHGNDDPSHPKFILSYGKDRRKNYKDLDSFPKKLDLRRPEKW